MAMDDSSLFEAAGTSNRLSYVTIFCKLYKFMALAPDDELVRKLGNEHHKLSSMFCIE